MCDDDDEDDDDDNDDDDDDDDDDDGDDEEEAPFWSPKFAVTIRCAFNCTKRTFPFNYNMVLNLSHHTCFPFHPSMFHQLLQMV